MRRGEIRVVRGAEPAQEGGNAVIVSNDGANQAATRLGRGAVTVVPITPNVTRIYAFQVLLPAGECGLAVDSTARAEQVRSVPVERVGRTVGQVPPALMTKVDHALRVHLGL